jgi:hypothetical protein
LCEVIYSVKHNMLININTYILCLSEQINLSHCITQPDSYCQKKFSHFLLLHFHPINKFPSTQQYLLYRYNCILLQSATGFSTRGRSTGLYECVKCKIGFCKNMSWKLWNLLFLFRKESIVKYYIIKS